MRWQDKLTKDEIQHVRDWCGETLKAFLSSREKHREMERERDVLHPESDNEPCWTCREIERKLNKRRRRR